jgi:hypothetical protein
MFPEKHLGQRKETIMEPDEVHAHLLSRFTDYAGAHLCAYCAFPGEVVEISHPTEFPEGFVCDDCHETVPCWHAFPEVDDNSEATGEIADLLREAVAKCDGTLPRICHYEGI